MKTTFYTVLMLMVFLVLVSCGDSSTARSVSDDTQFSAAEQAKMSEEKKAYIDEMANLKTLECTEACDCIPQTKIAKVLGWSNSSTTAEPTVFNDRISMCSLNNGGEVFLVRIARTSPRQPDPEYLKKKFQIFLDKGESFYKYKEVEDGVNQIILGTGRDKFGLQHWIARRRFGNDAMMRIEYTSDETMGQEKEKRVLQLISMIE